MVDLMHLGMFAIIFLALLGIVSNSSESSLLHIEQQMFLMNCPFPIYNGEATVNSIDGYTVNYTVSKSNLIKNNFNGTRFDCTIDPLSGPPQIGVSTAILQYGASTFWGTIPYGWIGYLSDTLGNLLDRMQAMFTIVGFFITPSNFNILGYTLGDLSGMALFVIVAVYAMCYIFIGIMIYKIVSPFSGVG